MKTGNENRSRHELRTFDKKGKLVAKAVYYVEIETGKMFDEEGKEVKEMKLECPTTKE